MFTKSCRPCSRANRQRAISTTLDKYPTGAEAVEAILSVYRDANPAEHATGLSWYNGKARQACEDIIAAAAATGRTITFRQAAGILAALSPATGWGDNTAGSIEFVITGRMSAQTPLFNARAQMILDGAEPLDVLGGRKVRSFFANLSDPDRSGPVTIDRHALSILFGRPLSEREQGVMLSLGGYTYAAAPYRAAARYLGMRPHELQAITWTVWRRQHSYRGRNADAQHSTAVRPGALTPLFSDPADDIF